MAKVYGVHQLQLRAGVKPEDFERMVVEEPYPLPRYEGWDWHLVKGDRGREEGMYLLVFEMESVEARDRVVSGQHTAADQKVTEAWGEGWQKFGAMVLRTYTDYAVVE